jgi:UDP-glucose 4-epimerase
VDRLFAEGGFTHVYHLAAYAAEGLSHFIRRFNYTNNVIGTVNLLNASVNNGVQTFVFTSSIAVYGEPASLPVSEAMVPRPIDPYGIAKYAVELDLRACHEMFGLDYIIFRPHNVFGPRQNIGDRYRNVVGIFMNQALQGRPMTIFGDGTQTRGFTYVADVAPLIAESVEVPAALNRVFNIGADEAWSLNDLSDYVAAAMEVDPNVVHLAARHEVPHIYADHAELRLVFGSRPQTLFHEGLARTAAWVREHGSRQTQRFEAIEINTKLPEAWRD